VLVVLTAIAAIDVLPVVRAPAHVNVSDWDAYGNMWALTWVARHLSQPSQMLAANMYYPMPDSLSCTENLLALAFQAAPLLALGASPLAAYNFVWFATFPLCGLGAYLLARHLSGSHLGSFLAALSFAFSSYRFSRLHHIQALSFQWLPFYLLLLLLSLKSPRPRYLVGMAVFAIAQALSSGYYAALLPLLTSVVLLFHLRAPGLRRALAGLTVAALLLVPVFYPYWRTQSRLGISRSRTECVAWSARWWSLAKAAPGTRSPLQPLLDRVVPGGQPPFYPGCAALVLGLAGVALWRQDRSVRLFVVIGSMAYLLSLGPEIQFGSWAIPGPYELLRGLPGYRSLRAPLRIYPLVGLALGTLAAIAWTHGTRRCRRVARWVAPLVLILATWESCPRLTDQFEEIMPPPAYTHVLASLPRGPVLELPDDRRHENAFYLYWSLVHGQWLVNGWGAYRPPTAARIAELGLRWPLPGATRLLADAGVRYVVVHLGFLDAKHRTRVETTPLPASVRLLYSDEGQRVYEIDPKAVEPKDAPIERP
jgi:hypothetical protein